MLNLIQSIYRDYRRYRATDESWFATLFLCQGFWASCVYRTTRAVLGGVRMRVLRRPLALLCVVLQKAVEVITGISIPTACEIGDGFYIGHFGGIILPAHGRIGRNCSVGPGVIIGLAGQGEARGAPIIGDRVFVGSHAIVAGRITVGDDAMICAGAVLTRSVPARAVVMGNPARVISYEGSFAVVQFDGMEHHEDRLRSMASRPGLEMEKLKTSEPTGQTKLSELAVAAR